MWFKNKQFFMSIKKRHNQTSITSKPSVQMSSNCIWGMSYLMLIISHHHFCILTKLKKIIILWRHFDVLTSSWRHNGWYSSERPFLDEQNGVGFMSLSCLELKLWTKMWFWPFWWPWPWPLTHKPVNFTNYSNYLYRSVQKV